MGGISHVPWWDGQLDMEGEKRSQLFGNTQMHFSQSFPFWKQTPRFFSGTFPKSPWHPIDPSFCAIKMHPKRCHPHEKMPSPLEITFFQDPYGFSHKSRWGWGRGKGCKCNPITDKKQERDTTDANPLFHVYKWCANERGQDGHYSSSHNHGSVENGMSPRFSFL